MEKLDDKKNYDKFINQPISPNWLQKSFQIAALQELSSY